ncbi:NTP transferase domain-containing protein [candidate division TA06 bacterium]|nr:NTP transferase domain-containing protein [candidate division TA06 bacterium]
MGLKVIIPTAGKGTRLRPHTNTTPKVLLHVAGKPVLGHILESLFQCTKKNPDFKIEELIIVYGYLGDRVIEYVKSEFEIRSSEFGIHKISFIKQEVEIGLGHAVYVCRDRFENEPVLILLGDTLFEVDYSEMIRSTGKDAYGTVGVRVLEDPRRFGIVETQNGYITKVVEKPKEKKRSLALIGLYYFEHSRPLFFVLDELVQNHESRIPPLSGAGRVTNHQSPMEWWEGEVQLTDGLQMLVDKGEKIRPFEIEGWFDCGTPEALLATNRHLLIRNAEGGVRDGELPTPKSEIRTRIIDSEIIPPVFIHPEVKIEGSKVGPYVSIGRGVSLKNVVLSDVIVNEHAVLEGVHLKERIVGENEVIKSSRKQ